MYDQHMIQVSMQLCMGNRGGWTWGEEVGNRSKLMHTIITQNIHTVHTRSQLISAVSHQRVHVRARLDETHGRI